jgi:hypothetical protein
MAKAQQSYSCTVTGSTNTACTWSVTEAGGGTMSPASGATSVYTAPVLAGTYHVVAASAAQPMATATATVTVVTPTVGNCSNLAATGTWENVTPAVLSQGKWCTPYHTGCGNPGTSTATSIATYGTTNFVLDPNNPGTVYLGTSSLGFFKSTDCGSTWTHVDTGAGASMIDSGRNWTIVMDPTDSNVLFTTAGYGAGGVWKSTDGAVSWKQVLTQNVLDATGASPCATTMDKTVCGGAGGFVEKITMDPTNSQHLLVSFHTPCAGTTPLPGAMVASNGDWGCLAESTDSGNTWSLTTSGMSWTGSDGPGQTMIDSKTWFYATNGTNGLYRTTTGGVSPDGHSSAWTQVYNSYVDGDVYKASNGVYYIAGSGISWSTDGISWHAMSGSPGAAGVNGSDPMVDDGTNLYVGSTGAFYQAPLGSGALTFTMMPSSAPLTSFASTSSTLSVNVAQLGYEKSHKILYTQDMGGGFWRVVVP